MANSYFSITTGDPLDTTTTFTAYIFIWPYWFDPYSQTGEIFLQVYRSVSSDAPGGAPVGQAIQISIGSSAIVDESGNTVQLLYTDIDDAGGNLSVANVFTALQSISVLWPANGESLDLSTATVLP